MPTAESILGAVTADWQSTGAIARGLIDRSLPHRVRKDHHAAVIAELRALHDEGVVESRYRELGGEPGHGLREWRLTP